MRQNAKGNKPQAARKLIVDEEDQLFLRGEFGDSNPDVLQRTVWWQLSLHFGFRARDESRRLKWGDGKLCGDEANGSQLLVWQSERGSKTRYGNSQQRAFNTVAEATNGKRCPVRFYREFLERRPEPMIDPEAPFFLTINHKRKPKIQCGIKKPPWVKTRLANFFRKQREAQISKATSPTTALEKPLFPV